MSHFIDNDRPLIFLAVQLPPPMHGLSNVNKVVVELVSRKFTNVRVLNTSGDGLGVRRYFTKFVRMLEVIRVLLVNAPRGKDMVYYMSVSGGLGMVFEILPWILAGFLSGKRIMHHHSFNYIYRKSFLMTVMQSLHKGNIVNLFLCNKHRSLFLAKYGRVNAGNCEVVSNEFVLKSEEKEKEERDISRLVVGHLSNLTFEKGFSKVIEVFERLKDRLDICFRIAGPVNDDKVKGLLDRYTMMYPDKFVYDGAVYGDVKDNWYRSIDIFLFPSMYRNETYPLVVVEAVSYNVLPLTTSIACMPDINSSYFMSDSEEYVDFCTFFLIRFINDTLFREECLSRKRDLGRTLSDRQKQTKVELLRSFEIPEKCKD